jgi:hypothetical protein
MPETPPQPPLDLSAFDNLDPLPSPSHAITTHPVSEPHLLVSTDERLLPQPRLQRLVEVANLSPEDLAAAHSAFKSFQENRKHRHGRPWHHAQHQKH